MLLRAVVPLVLLVLLAGCLDGSGNEAPAADAQTATPAADGTVTPAVEDVANATAPDAAMPITTPVSYSGSSPVGVCEFMAVGACVFPVAGSEDFHLIEAPGQAKRLNVQVTYAGQLPGLDFYVGFCSGDEEPTDCANYVTGPSPFTLDVDLSSYPPGTVFALSIGSVVTPAMMAGAGVFGPADFQVEGTLTSIPVSA